MLKLLVWFLIASVLLVVGYVFLIGGSAMGMVAPSLDWKRWPAIRRARKRIREVARQRCSNAKVFSHQGATKIDPRYLNFLITTDTDRERDLMRNDSQIYEQFCNVLLMPDIPSKRSRPFISVLNRRKRWIGTMEGVGMKPFRCRDSVPLLALPLLD
jgi:hypothetical protein